MKAFVVTVLVLAVAIGAMAWAGWLTFSSSDTQTTIRVEKREIKEDVDRAVEKGKQWKDEAARKTHDGRRETVP